MKMKNTFYRTVLLIIILAVGIAAVTKESIDQNLKVLASKATYIAQARLAENPGDKRSLTLIKFAHNIYPTYKPLLLLRAKLKYKVTIKAPEQEVKEEGFSENLKTMTTLITDENDEKNRYILSVLYNLIRIYEPENEEALIALMRFSDAGIEVNLDKLLTPASSVVLSKKENLKYDPKDPRYVISNVKKTVVVPADSPWTDSWVKVKAGQVIRIWSTSMWSLGDGPFPMVDADGYENLEKIEIIKSSQPKIGKSKKTKKSPKVIKRNLKGFREGNPGCLVAKIGNKKYYTGKKCTFTAESSGILYFGPYEWDDYSDNHGELIVTIEVSDK